MAQFHNIPYGKRLLLRRERCEMDRRTLSKLSGVPYHVIRHLESGGGLIRFDVLPKILSILGMTTAQFFALERDGEI